MQRHAKIRAKSDMTFDTLSTRWTWKPIRNCPGRYRLVDVPADLPVDALVGKEAEVARFSIKTAADEVLVVSLDRGGMISYKRSNGTYLHTLNDPDGFERKLRQLGIEAP